MSGATLRKVVAVTALLVACSSDSSGPPATVASVAVSAPASTVPITGTLQLSAVPRDAGGNALSDRPVTWSSGDTAVARVSTAGLVTGRALGAVTITATVEGIPGSLGITVVTGPPARLSFLVQPLSTTSGTVISPAVQVEVQDAAGNRVTGASTSITLTLGANPKNGSLGGTTVQAATNGVATFNSLSIDSAAAGYTLAAAATGLTGATSGTFNITVGAAAKLGFRVPPANTTGGATISPAVQVEIRDAGGNRVTSATNSVTLAIGTNPKSGTLGGTVSVPAVSGVASFNSLTIDSAGAGYTLIANAAALTAATSAAFNVAVGPAASLAFLVQPTSTAGGVAIAPAVQVEVRDAGGNRVTTATTSISLAIGTNPTGGVLSGAGPIAPVSGVATFPSASIDKDGNGYTLTASGGGLPTATSTPFNIAIGGATKLGFFVQPANTPGGAVINPAVQIEILDAGGNRVTSATNIITIGLGTNPNAGTLSGTKTVAAVNGLATFSTLNVDSAGIGYTLTAAATGLTVATSNAFNITVGAAAKLGFRVQPANTTGGAVISPAVQVEVRDAGGNRVTSATNSITVAIGTNPNSGTLGGTKTVAASAGVASFNTLTVDSAGTGYTLTANAMGLTTGTSSSFNVTVGAAAKLGFRVQPSNEASGTAIAPAIEVEVRDSGGNRVTTANTGITLALGNNPKNGTLGGTTTRAAASGLATFNNLTIDSAATGYTLTAVATGLTGATSASFNITVGAAAKLGLLVQPASTTGGATISPAVQVEVRDAGGNRVTSASNSITMAIGTNPNSGTLGGTKTVAAASGLASFGTLSIDSAGTGYTLSASASGLTAVTSSSFNITVGPAVKLGFLVPPSSTASGATITPAVQVEVRDAGGNRVTTANSSITLAIGTNPGGGTLSGTKTQAAASGVAMFSNLSIDKAGTGYTLTAAASGLTGATSAPFNITGGTADHLGFFVQPSNDTAGSPISPAVQVEVLDAAGNRVTTDTRNITVAILDNPGGGTLSGTKTLAASAGVASFSGLSVDKAGTSYTLLATSSPVLTSATSAEFNIAPAAPSRAHFFVEPSSATAGAAITPDIQVEILDAFGNRVGTATNSVTVALLANPGGGTLSGTKSRNASAGVATFSGLSINKAVNGYTIRATASGVATTDTSVAFNITPGPATQLAFTTQPVNTAAGAAMAAVVVTARDAQGNTATGFTGDVAMAIGANPGSSTLSGTLSVPAVSGVATFSNLSIDKVGTGYTLTAASTGLTGATSGTFNITVGAAAKLAFGQQPTASTGGSAISPAMTVRILDANGNLTGSTANVTLGITSGTGTAGAHLGGTVTRDAVAGVATFNDISIDSAGTAYTLNATSSGLTADTSTAFNVAVGTGTKLDFLVQPSTTPPGGTITPAVQVEIRDAGGNLVTTDNTTNVTVAIGTNPSGGALAGTKTQSAVAGVATFSNLSINNAGSGYTLTAGATGFTGATSNSFDIVVGTAAKLAFIVQPANTAGGATISPAVQVQIQDAGGNPVTTATNSVTLAIGTNPKNGSHLSGTLTRAAVAGVATFNNLSVDSAGTGYTLTAASFGLTGATSSSFNITVGPASKLGFRVQPSNTTGGAAITPAVQIEVRDAGGNRVTTAGNSITMAIGTNPSSGTLSGTTTLAASSGLATFSTLSIDSAGTGYRLSATASGLSSATSSTFNVAVGAPAKLAFLVEPSDAAAGSSITPAVKVEILDAGGNLTTATSNVTVAIGTNPSGGALGGTKTVAAVSGVATFSNLSINKTGVGYTLQTTSGTLTPATSAPFDIGADGVDGSLSTLVAATDTIGQCLFSCAPGIRSSTVTVTVRDQLGNLVSGAPVVLSAGGTGNAFAPSATGNTDANGVFTADFNSSDFGPKTVSATAGGVGISQTAAVAVMPVLVGAGDIADCNSVRDDATANQLDSIPGTVFVAGDNAYPNGRAVDFTNCYDPTWGRQKARTKPVVGNHEYDSSGTAAAYFNYFTPAVADPLGNTFGYYSFELGTWHVVVLNSDSGVTSPSSAQLTWLQNDLVGRSNQCVLALWHRPLFTSGGSGGAGIRVRRLWQALEDAGAEIVINGHDHLYERFAPQDSLGIATAAGIREFIVGTGGGETHSNYVNNPPNVEASDAGNFSRGVLRLTLYAKAYRWEFLPAQGQGTYTDSGTASCH